MSATPWRTSPSLRRSGVTKPPVEFSAQLLPGDELLLSIVRGRP